MDRATAEKRAAEIAKDIEGPLGRVPLERVFSKHVDFFSELKTAGVTWPQIASLLGRCGITRKDGTPLNAAQVRATVSRIHASQGADDPPARGSARPITDPQRQQKRQGLYGKVLEAKRPHGEHSATTGSVREKMLRALKSRR